MGSVRTSILERPRHLSGNRRADDLYTLICEEPVIPQPSDQIAHRKRRGSSGGRPPTFDAVTYKGRNIIERSFNDHKQWRGIATRYDKLATVYRGAVVLRAITMWLTT